jgi:formate hydrogenlyase subunit 6/NADH:ubiquinone oxidoreductase subunit I
LTLALLVRSVEEKVYMPWMLPNILKNLVRGPVTRRYPFEVREPIPGFRGKLIFLTDDCNVCGACAKLCPVNAITVDKEKGEVCYFPFKCIYCATCVEACPYKALEMDNHHTPPSSHKDEEVYHVEKKAKEGSTKEGP